MNSLKTCPFCNGKVEIKYQAWGVAGLIQCSECNKLFMIPWNQAETMQHLAETWNTRKGSGKG